MFLPIPHPKKTRMNSSHKQLRFTRLETALEAVLLSHLPEGHIEGLLEVTMDWVVLVLASLAQHAVEYPQIEAIDQREIPLQSFEVFQMRMAVSYHLPDYLQGPLIQYAVI